jgi:hypothetical protein
MRYRTRTVSSEGYLVKTSNAEIDNVFVGIKDTGHFQHSSLTAGGLGISRGKRNMCSLLTKTTVTSAGLIEVKDGLVTSISPLSGHYR